MSVSEIMDPYKLLSRSSKLATRRHPKNPDIPPSSGLPLSASTDVSKLARAEKRRRGAIEQVTTDTVYTDDLPEYHDGEQDVIKRRKSKSDDDAVSVLETWRSECAGAQLSLEQRKEKFKQHKLKATHLDPDGFLEKAGWTGSRDVKKGKYLFPAPLLRFSHLQAQYGVSRRLMNNLIDQGYSDPTDVQLAAVPLLLDDPRRYVLESNEYDEALAKRSQIDLLTVAPTGSGKTLAYMIPLVHNLFSTRQQETSGIRNTSAIILAPTRELAAQITNEGRKICRGTGLTISQIKKGMRLPVVDKDTQMAEQRRETSEEQHSVIKSDIVVSTPGLLHNIMSECRNLAWQIRHLVLDEADVLLDPVFREQTLQIWNELREPNLRVSLWSATIGSSIEALAVSTIQKRREDLELETKTEIAEAPLVRLVVGLKDSALPNVTHKFIYAATEKGKLMGLRQVLRPTSSSTDSGPTLQPPFLVFTQTIERAIALHSELVYDIPTEAGGDIRLAVLHSHLSDTARDSVMTRFRRGEIWVLITTDLFARGMDFRGINGVVNYDIPTSSALYVHRAGRTGRAGRDGGFVVTLYAEEDVPFLRQVANVVKSAKTLDGAESGVQPWFIDALPQLSKNDKQNLKKHGVESRTAKGQQKDPSAARKSRISTKAGFVRREENNRRGAILASQRRALAEDESDDEAEVDFEGFD